MKLIDKKGAMILIGALILALFIGIAYAEPDVYYYGSCTVPTNEHFLSFPTGILDYHINTVDPVHNSDNPMINTYSGISERQKSYKLGMSKNEQEKLALLTAGKESGSALWCYTLPDPVQEDRFNDVSTVEVQDPNKGYFTNDDGSITIGGEVYVPDFKDANGGISYIKRAWTSRA